MTFKRVLQLSSLALLLIPTAAFADAINVDLTGGSWNLNGGNNTISLTSGSTTLLTGTFSPFIPFGGSAGSSNSSLDIGSSSFSCTSCLSANEFFQFSQQGNGKNVVYLSGNIDDSGSGDTGTFSAVLDESGGSGHGSIASGSISLNLDTQASVIPTPEPSTWVLMMAGLVLLASTALVRRMGWFAPIAAEETHQS